MKFYLVPLILALSSASSTPNFRGCDNEAAQGEEYCDTTLSVDQRVASLRSSLTLAEKIKSAQPYDNGNTCGTTTSGIDRVGLSEYTWLIETNTNIASACLDEDTCATCFIGPMGMGSSFNRTSWRMKGEVFGNEMRAFNNLGWHRTTNDGNDKIGLTGYGPNINLSRDPRFGRNSELPGEDPLLNGEYAKHLLFGMQEEDSNGHPKMIAYVKHLTAYSTETNRGHDNYNISKHDLFESYLPAYEKAFVEGKAAGAMCSYNAINGAPSCANDYLNNQIVRGWAPSAHITTDCGAVGNLKGDPVNAGSDEEAAAMAMNGGADLDMGDLVMTEALESAVEMGLVTEDLVDAAWTRAFTLLFRAGRFDPPESVEWSKFGKEDINSDAHKKIAFEAALQGQILLKNDGTLPLENGVDVAVIGPMSSDPSLYLSSYASDDICYGSASTGDYSCMTSIYEAIEKENSGKTTVAEGCDISGNSTAGFNEAMKAAKEADVVVLALGIDKSIERETQDRTDTALPGVQEKLALEILALGKKVVVVLANGGTLAIDNLMEGPGAIVETFNPAVEGPKALAQSLFGLHNKWGKLPVTMYPHSYINEQSLINYDMSLSPGRTYRYYDNEPLYSFGHGLSYTDFDLECDKEEDKSTVTCSVSNLGDVDGDEVVFVYHAAGNDTRKAALDHHPVPIKALVDFERVTVEAGKSVNISFKLSKDVFKLVNEDGEKTLYHGDHQLIFSRGHGKDVALNYVV